jgi:hypothetical protein
MAQSTLGIGKVKIMRLVNLTLAFLLAGAPAVFAQQFPPQPAAPQLGSEAERAACRPDVVKFCQAELSANQDDVFAILACLQRNRGRISPSCQQVLANNGR